MNTTPKFFKSVDAYKAYRQAWAQRCHRREVLPFAMQLFHRVIRSLSMAPSVSKKTTADTVSRAFRAMSRSQYTSSLVVIQAWPEYDDWFDMEQLKNELELYQPSWDGVMTYWPEVENLAVLLNN